MNMEYNNSEKDMLLNIDKNINSDFFIELLKNNYEKYHNIHYIGDLIGELYTHHIIHKDGFGFEEYMNKIDILYSKYHDKQISPEEFERQRSVLIASAIANKLNINISEQLSQDDLLNIKNYFLNEYVTNGYVAHSFPDAYYDSIIKNGLIASTDERPERPMDIQEIQNIFMSKGVVSPMGGYPYYGGSGIYYEHDFTKVFQHAIDSPEWFNWFTSADHTSVYHKDVETSPYILRSEADCRKNVEDLCENAGLDLNESKQVLDFFQRQYDKFSSPKLNVALIPKKIVGKDDINATDVGNLDLISSISYVLKDGARQYTEHNGNVCFETILPQDFNVSVIPSASKYMYANQYFRETKEHLTSVESNMAIIKNAENNKQRLIPSMVPKIEEAKQIISKKKDFDKNSVIENILLSNSRGYLDIIKNEYGPYMSEEKLSFLEKLKESNIIKVESNGKEYIKNQIREILNDVNLSDEEKQKKTSDLEVPLAHGGRVFDDDVIHFYPYDKLKDSSQMTTEQLAYKCNMVLIHELLHYFIRPNDMDVSNNPSLKGINSFTSEGLVDMCARDIHTKYGLIPDYESDYSSNVLFTREALGNVGTRDEQMNLVFNGSISDFYQRTTTEDYNSINEAVDAKNNNTSFDRALFGIAKIGEGVSPYSAEQIYRGNKNISANYPSKDAALNDITQQICVAYPASAESVNSVISTYTSESKSNIKQKNDTMVKTLKLSNNNNSDGNGNNNSSNGFMNVMILSLLVGFFEGIVFVLTYIFLAK